MHYIFRSAQTRFVLTAPKCISPSGLLPCPGSLVTVRKALWKWLGNVGIYTHEFVLLRFRQLTFQKEYFSPSTGVWTFMQGVTCSSPSLSRLAVHSITPHYERYPRGKLGVKGYLSIFPSGLPLHLVTLALPGLFASLLLGFQGHRLCCCNCWSEPFAFVWPERTKSVGCL